MGAFFGIWKALEVPPHATTVESDSPSPLRIGSTILVAALVILLSRWIARKRGKAIALNAEGINLAALGRNYEALQKYESAKALMPKDRSVRTNIAATKFALWKLRESYEELTKLVEETKADASALANLILTLQSLVGVFTNNIPAVASALETLRARKQPRAGLALLAEGMRTVRQKDWVGALAILDSRELDQLGGQTRALRDAAAAWCEHGLHKTPRSFDRIALFAEADPSEFEALWPDFAAFIVDH